MLVDAIVGLKVATAQSKALSSSLQASGRQVVLRGMAARSHLMTVVGHLQSTGLPFALLKGAARLYTDDPDATLNASADFDILVRGADVDAISAALRARGYSYRADLEQQEQYRADHHHAAPLFPPDEGCIIELHYDLAPPGTLSIPLNWEALEAHMVAAQGPCGPVMCLDRIRAALHLIVHSVGMHRLRDSVLLARHMSRLDRRELDELRQTISMERIDPIRLSAAAALAARMARVAWPVSGSVEEYLRWQLRREDVPLYFSQRSQLAEGWYACGRRLGPLAWRLLDPTAGLREREGARPPLLALIGRVATSVAAFAYTSMMRPAG